MMDTTTSGSGVSDDTQPTTTEAVTDGNEQVITQDENGTPVLTPINNDSGSDEVASTDDSQSADDTAAPTEEAQATETDSEIVEWAKKKGIEINPENPNEIKLARLQLENDRRFHEAQQNKPVVTPPEVLEPTGDPNYDAIVERQNANEIKMYVRDWFDANPEMKEYRMELSRIASERPWLQDMDDVKAHFLADPSRTASLKKEGGREALQNLAQKQQQVPPTASATNSAQYQTQQITAANVYDLIDQNDQSWYEKNYEAINKAISGK